MTINPLSDGEAVTAPLVNSIANAPALEGVISGCTPSKGTGDWDVDIASGEVIIGTNRPSVSADTITITDPDSDPDLDSGEFRVDLITSDTAGSLSATEGTPASEPNAPDIPNNEVLIAAVVVSGNASALTAADIYDYRTIINSPNIPDFQEDDNSPLTSTGSQNHTYTLASSYTHIWVFVDVIDEQSGSGQTLKLRFDGDTGTNYFYVDNSDTRTASASEIDLTAISANGQASGWLYITGKGTDRPVVRNLLAEHASTAGMAVTGHNNNITMPLDNFTLRGGSGNIDVSIQVFGQ